jgi:hypothetical protein
MSYQDQLVDCFKNCDHFFIISPQKTFTDNSNPYLGFIGLMDRMYTVARTYVAPRRIGWIVDQMEMRRLQTPIAARKFDNIQQLRSRLLACAIRYGDGDRIRWLCDCGRVFVRKEDALVGPCDLLFGDQIPESWAKDPAFRDAYGDDFANIRDLNVSAFWAGGQLTCYAHYMRDGLPRMTVLTPPGDEYLDILGLFRGEEPQIDGIRSLSIPDFIETF